MAKYATHREGVLVTLEKGASSITLGTSKMTRWKMSFSADDIVLVFQDESVCNLLPMARVMQVFRGSNKKCEVENRKKKKL